MFGAQLVVKFDFNHLKPIAYDFRNGVLTQYVGSRELVFALLSYVVKTTRAARARARGKATYR